MFFSCTVLPIAPSEVQKSTSEKPEMQGPTTEADVFNFFGGEAAAQASKMEAIVEESASGSGRKTFHAGVGSKQTLLVHSIAILSRWFRLDR